MQPKFKEEALRLKTEADTKIQQAIRAYSE